MSSSSAPASRREDGLMAEYPKRADLFKKWSEAMLRGATVDKPTYSKTFHVKRKGMNFPHKRRRRRRRRGRKVLKGE